MNARLSVDESSRLAFERGVRLQFDRNRDAWTLMAPEKVVVLDDIAHAIVEASLTAPVSVAEAIDALAASFEAPRDEIAGDVVNLLQAHAAPSSAPR